MISIPAPHCPHCESKGLSREFKTGIFLYLEDPHPPAHPSAAVLLLTGERMKGMSLLVKAKIDWEMADSPGIAKGAVRKMPAPGPFSLALLLGESPGTLSTNSRGQKEPVA